MTDGRVYNERKGIYTFKFFNHSCMRSWSSSSVRIHFWLAIDQQCPNGMMKIDPLGIAALTFGIGSLPRAFFQIEI